MPEVEDPEVTINRLREELRVTRKERMEAQKAAAADPLLREALGRASRDRSSRSTSETEALRDEVAELWTQISDEAYGVDRIRQHFSRADEAFPDLQARSRVVSALNAETRWRSDLLRQDMAVELRLELPIYEEIS